MPVAREDDDTVASGRGIPHGLEDLLALDEEATPGVLDVDGPVLCEGDGRGDDLPLDASRFGAV